MDATNSSGQPLNYFSYFTEIEEAFVRQRGRHLLLSPADWTLMKSWQERGIPLHVVLRSMETVFKRHSQNSKHAVRSLFYCRNEIEAQFGQWLRNQVGNKRSITGKSVEQPEASEAHLPFPRAFILEHLDNCLTSIKTVLDALPLEEGFSESLRSVNAELGKLVLNFTQAATPDCGELEAELIKLENILKQATSTHLLPNQLAALRSEAERQLTSYRSRMPPDHYEQVVADLMHKRMCESTGIPRLSLFYL